MTMFFLAVREAREKHIYSIYRVRQEKNISKTVLLAHFSVRGLKAVEKMEFSSELDFVESKSIQKKVL